LASSNFVDETNALTITPTPPFYLRIQLAPVTPGTFIFYHTKSQVQHCHSPDITTNLHFITIPTEWHWHHDVPVDLCVVAQCSICWTAEFRFIL